MSYFFMSVLCKIKNYLYRSKHQKKLEYLERYQLQQQLPQKQATDLSGQERRLASSVQSGYSHIQFLSLGFRNFALRNRRS